LLAAYARKSKSGNDKKQRKNIQACLPEALMFVIKKKKTNKQKTKNKKQKIRARLVLY
jgi:tRNA A37 threonylcarbamoyladenosine synthetase subunit TsaC/SUA5/YrdC